jgi:hypothetical protein
MNYGKNSKQKSIVQWKYIAFAALSKIPRDIWDIPKTTAIFIFIEFMFDSKLRP